MRANLGGDEEVNAAVMELKGAAMATIGHGCAKEKRGGGRKGTSRGIGIGWLRKRRDVGACGPSDGHPTVERRGKRNEGDGDAGGPVGPRWCE